MHYHRVPGEGTVGGEISLMGAVSHVGFVVWPCGPSPMGGQPDGWMQSIYALAYQNAQRAVLRPWNERCLLASPN